MSLTATSALTPVKMLFTVWPVKTSVPLSKWLGRQSSTAKPALMD